AWSDSVLAGGSGGGVNNGSAARPVDGGAGTDRTGGGKGRGGDAILAALGEERGIAFGDARSGGDIADAPRAIVRAGSAAPAVAADRLALQRCAGRIIDASLASTAHAYGSRRIDTLLIARALGENTAIVDGVADLASLLA